MVRGSSNCSVHRAWCTGEERPKLAEGPVDALVAGPRPFRGRTQLCRVDVGSTGFLEEDGCLCSGIRHKEQRWGASYPLVLVTLILALHICHLPGKSVKALGHFVMDPKRSALVL